jgi:MFS family permease
LLVFLSFIIFKFSGIKDNNIKKKIDSDFIKNFFDFFKDKDRKKAYILGGGVNFWLILIYLYMPIFILNSGLNDLWIGYFLFATALPALFLEYYLAKLAGKTGFKKIFKLGYLILSFAALICFFVGNIYFIMLILVLASIGLSMIEPTTEAYFFHTVKTKEQENKYYGPYNTTIDISQFIVKILGGVLLWFLPFKFLFLFFGLFMFGYFLICFKIKEIREDKMR